MPHYKGVSYKSDNKILQALLENRKGLQWSDLLEKTGLHKDTLGKRLGILKEQSDVKREPIKGKHGHNIRYSIPWYKYEEIYHRIYKKPSPWALEIKENFVKFFSRFGEVEASITQEKITMKLKLPSLDRYLTISAEEEFQSFLKEHPWITESDADVLGNYTRWLNGDLCDECMKNHFPKPLRLDEDTREYVCSDCGVVFNEPPMPDLTCLSQTTPIHDTDTKLTTGN